MTGHSEDGDCGEDLVTVARSSHGKKQHLEEQQQRGAEARRRWRLLSKVLREKRAVDRCWQVLATPGAACGEVRYLPRLQHCYTVAPANTSITVNIRLLPRPPPLTPDRLMGFDYTGNICVWSSEELLLQYCVSAHSRWAGRRLLELAGGCTALAGLWMSASGVCSHVTLSDGHPACVAGIRGCVRENTPLPTPTTVRWLQWPLEDAVDTTTKLQQYDVILAADCVFSEGSHLPLSDALWRLLVEGGEVVLAAPHRCGREDGSSLTRFAAAMASRGFRPTASDAGLSRDVHAAATRIGAILPLNQRPHLLLLQKPHRLRFTDSL